MKWRFKQCWWIPAEADLDDWDPMLGDYQYKPRVPGRFIEDVPEDGTVTQITIHRGSHPKEWCAEGFIELDDRIPEDVAYELAWEAVVKRAYTTVPETMDGSEFEHGSVEPERMHPSAREAISSADLDVINRHRVRIGQSRLDPAASQWSADDVTREAWRIRALNPAEIKQRLLR